MNKIEKMLLGISIMIFGYILMSYSQADERGIFFIVPIIGFVVCLYSYFKYK